MARGFKFRNCTISQLQGCSRGYILITLMLFLTLLAMTALAVLPEITHQIQRDREEEMIHRGTEYMRAIKKYYKKLGRYPTKLEDLETTSQKRYLRKRYKDPMYKDKDFKLVHSGDPVLNMLGMGGVGLGPGGQLAGLANVQGLNQTGGTQGFVTNSSGGVRPATPQDANTPQVTGLPGQQNADAQPPAGTDAENQDTQVDDSAASSPPGSASAPWSPSASPNQTFGGGAILGVASLNKATTIREFNKKNHYNEWVFIYDPTVDRGGLLKGPVQPEAGRPANVNQQPAAGSGPSGIQQQPQQQPSPPQQGQEPPE